MKLTSTTSRIKWVSMPLFALLTACGADLEVQDESPTKELNPSFSIHIMNPSDIVITDGRLKLQLYGTDRRVQDNSATLISEVEHNVTSIPLSLRMSWPEDSYNLIDNPPVAQQEDAVYYVRLSIDANNDGVLCQDEDYIQDYEKTPFFTLEEPPSEPIEFHIRPAEQEQCVMF